MRIYLRRPEARNTNRGSPASSGAMIFFLISGCCRAVFPVGVIRFRSRRGLSERGPAEPRAGRAGSPRAARSVVAKTLGPVVRRFPRPRRLLPPGSSVWRYPRQHRSARGSVQEAVWGVCGCCTLSGDVPAGRTQQPLAWPVLLARRKLNTKQ